MIGALLLMISAIVANSQTNGLNIAYPNMRSKLPSVPQCNPSCEVLQKCDEADRCNTDSCQDYLDEKQGMKPKTDCMFYCSKDYCKCTTDFKRSPITQTCIQKELCPAAIKQHNAAFESQNPYPDSSIDPDPFGKLAKDTPPTL